jgi:hypothetical protein
MGYTVGRAVLEYVPSRLQSCMGIFLRGIKPMVTAPKALAVGFAGPLGPERVWSAEGLSRSLAGL